MEERQKSALNLLEFAAKYSQLFTSTIFVKFFEVCGALGQWHKLFRSIKKLLFDSMDTT